MVIGTPVIDVSKSQRDDVKLLVASLEKRVHELSKDSAKIQKVADVSQRAMGMVVSKRLRCFLRKLKRGAQAISFGARLE